jgi:ribosomal protein L24
MFRRLRSLFHAGPQAGDLVRVIAGPHAGKAGTVTSVRGDDVTVDVAGSDELAVEAASLRVVRRAALSAAGAPDAGTDIDYEEARARINQLPPPMI